MKQNINIEYTEKEFENVFSFFGSIVDTCSSLAHKAMDMENERRIRYEKEDKKDDLKSKIQDHKEETDDMFKDIIEDIQELKDTKRSIRDIQRTLASLALQIQSLEDDNDDLVPGEHF